MDASTPLAAGLWLLGIPGPLMLGLICAVLAWVPGDRTVFTGGGDGTFVSWVNHILDRAEPPSAPAPRVHE